MSATWAFSCASCACRWVYCRFLFSDDDEEVGAVGAVAVTVGAVLVWYEEEGVVVERWGAGVVVEVEGFGGWGGKWEGRDGIVVRGGR